MHTTSQPVYPPNVTKFVTVALLFLLLTSCPIINPTTPPPIRRRGNTTTVWGPWRLSSTDPDTPDRNKVFVIFLCQLLINLALNRLTANNHTVHSILYLTIMAHLSTVTNSWRTTRSLIQTLALSQFLTPSVELTTSYLPPIILGITLFMPESSYITQIINQISTVVVLPHRIDTSTLIFLSSVLGATHLIFLTR